MTTKEVFAAAADLLEKEGWGQGRYAVPDGNDGYGIRCMSGAIMAVTVGDYFRRDNTPEANKSCLDATTELAAKLGFWPSHWNDAPGRTAQEVIAKLRELAS